MLSYYVRQKDAVITKYKRAMQSYEEGEIIVVSIINFFVL